MRHVSKVAVVLLMLLCAQVNAQVWDPCLGGSCSPQSAVASAINDTPSYVWQAYTDVQFVLRKDGVVIGQWYIPEHTYYPFKDGVNGPAAKPPIDPPNTAPVCTEAWKCSGVDASQVHGHDHESVTFCGKALHPSRMAEAMGGSLTDDSSKGHFVVIAKNKTDRDSVLEAWGRLPTEFTSRYNVWAVEPSHFSMQDRTAGKPRFYTEGDPTVVLQNSKAEVLFRRPQANQAFKVSDIQDLLKSDPDYKPALDPGAPPAPILGPLSHVTAPQFASAACVVAALALIGFHFLRKK